VAHVLERSGEFDLIHNHLDWLPLAFAASFKAPLLTTIHGFSGRGILPAYQNAHASAFVAISDADRAPELDYVATVHHGIDLTLLPFSSTTDGSLVVFGRIHPDKGTATAIDIARSAGRRLIICGIVQDAQYFETHVEPHIDGDRVVYLNSVGPTQRAEVLGRATALLHPIAFNEPFGLSVVEAMACGTPVIAYARGSMPELIEHGVTGYLVNSVSAAAQAVDAAGTLDRLTIRTSAERRFGVARMIDDYLAVYRRVLQRTNLT
jgi:glycosyltransferase involved in cell wall biosynthesis